MLKLTPFLALDFIKTEEELEAYVAERIADALADQRPTTADGVRVAPGDTVWVLGSVDVHEARVRPLDALTDYYLFGLLPVSESYSTQKAALQARKIGHLAGKAGA